MTVLLTGSVAYDYIMVFPGHFKENILANQGDRLSVSFLVDSLKKQRGGVAPNIAYNLALLGERPKILATVGEDFAEYRRWLELHGIDTSAIVEIPGEFTASFFASTDREQNQLGMFYTGAMAYAHQVALKDHVGDGVELAVISPNDPRAMVQYVRECKELGIPYIYDVSQQIPRLNAEDLLEGLCGSKMLTLNDCEFGMLKDKTGWADEQIAAATETLIVTRGESGSIITRREGTLEIPTATPRRIVEPTGVGDAYRGGIIKGMLCGLDWETTGRIGSLAATYALEEHGPQNHHYTLQEFVARYREVFGDTPGIEKLEIGG